MHVLVVALLLSITACRKRAAPSPTPASSESAAPASSQDSPAPLPNAATARLAGPDPAALAAEARALAENLQFYNGLLQQFIAEQKRFPTSFKEFESTKLDSARRPPPGKRWELDPHTKRVVVLPAAK